MRVVHHCIASTRKRCKTIRVSASLALFEMLSLPLRGSFTFVVPIKILKKLRNHLEARQRQGIVCVLYIAGSQRFTRATHQLRDSAFLKQQGIFALRRMHGRNSQHHARVSYGVHAAFRREHFKKSECCESKFTTAFFLPGIARSPTPSRLGVSRPLCLETCAQ